MESPFTTIIKVRADFRDSHGPAADGLVAAIDQGLAARIAASPLGVYGSEFYKSQFAPLQHLIESAGQRGQPPGDTIVELLRRVEAQANILGSRVSARPLEDLLTYALEAFHTAAINMRWKANEAAKQLNNKGSVEAWLPKLITRRWIGRIFENLKAMLKPGESIENVDWFMITTSQRQITRDQAEAEGRMAAEMNDAFYAKNFESDANIRKAQNDEAELNNPQRSHSFSSNIDWKVRSPGDEA